VRGSWLEFSAANAFRVVLAAGLLLTLAANLPGHMSVDSVISLYEGRTGVRQTWAPAIGSWLLGRFDDAVTGTGLYVTASATLLYVSLMALAGLRGRATWLAPLLAAPLALTPGLVIYQGIVWRDVLFANLAVAAFVFLAYAGRAWSDRRPWGALAVAFLCLTLAALVRQNGVILVAAATLALAWIAGRRGWRRGLAWGLGGFATVAFAALALNAFVQPKATAPKLRPHAAARILQHYDVVGVLAHEPGLRLPILAKANPAFAATIESEGPRRYSPERVETLDQAEALRKSLWRSPDAAMSAQWRTLLAEHPGAYLAHRADVFRQVLLTPDLKRCLPVHTGVAGPPEMLEALGVAQGLPARDEALANYASRFYGTPLYSHLAYGALALAVMVLLLIRRDPADIAIAALMLGMLAFAASFFVIAVACDYRYLYPLDLAAVAGLLYLALDPRLRRAEPA
jgi:hypothetical protein